MRFLSCRLKILWRSFLCVCWPGCLYKLMMMMFWDLHVTVMPPQLMHGKMLILLKHIESRIKNEVPLKPWERFVWLLCLIISTETFDFEVVILREKCFLKINYVIESRCKGNLERAPLQFHNKMRRLQGRISLLVVNRIVFIGGQSGEWYWGEIVLWWHMLSFLVARKEFYGLIRDWCPCK